MLSRYQTPQGQHRQGRRTLFTMSILAIATLAAAHSHQRPILVYNPSGSAPLGLYVTRPPEPLARGDWVLIAAPDAARKLADQRGYLPASVPMLKHIVALWGDNVCAYGRFIWINDRPVAERLDRDSEGRNLPRWMGCYVLSQDEVFVLNPNPKSFDSRYFGAVKRRDVRARLIRL